ncbi:hypothetical protein [Methylotuvimicrobium sp. KM1]|uniref:hypothetical protein n=1 Tax=Methylotuvimicrobium sp. KM1 TaxID=3377707 RepID=UPI003850F529
MLPKRPRQYANEIVMMNSREERLVALEKVPEELRSWVRELAEDAYKKKKRHPIGHKNPSGF